MLSERDSVITEAQLDTVDLSGKTLEDDDISVILNTLPNDQYKALRLSNNNMTNNMITEVLQWVSAHKKLQELNLAFNSLDNKIVLGFGAAITQNTHLININIGGNKFNQAGMHTMLTSFKLRTNLVELHLSHSAINTIDHIKLIVEILKNNPDLTTLNLAMCKLNGHFINDVLRAATIHPSLQVLDLSSNRFNTLDSALLLNLFQHNTTLTSINLTGNSLTKECTLNLVQAYNQRNPDSKVKLIFSDEVDAAFKKVLTMVQNASRNMETTNNNNQENKDGASNTFKRKKI